MSRSFKMMPLAACALLVLATAASTPVFAKGGVKGSHGKSGHQHGHRHHRDRHDRAPYVGGYFGWAKHTMVGNREPRSRMIVIGSRGDGGFSR